MNKWVSLAISALSDFVITAGTAYMAIGGTEMPAKYQLAACVIGGLVQSARGIQKSLAPAPV
jgi:hypothetical protein